jgi:hypothetical protein
MIDDFRWIDTALSIGSLKAVPWELAVSEEPIKFFMLGSAPTDIERLVEEHDRRNPQPNILLHTDLGGETWSFFDLASRESMQRFSQIVCELHNLESLSDTWWYRKIRRVFEKLADDYAVVHLHANNAGGTASIHGIVLPRVLQVSFANKQTYSFVATDELFPGELELPCDPSQPDIWLGSFRF